jgi:hypothetical protein
MRRHDRLRQPGIDEPTEVDRTVENLTGRPSRARQTSYRERRKQLLLALLDQHTDRVDNAAEEIGAFFDRLSQVGVRGLVAEQLKDAGNISAYRDVNRRPRPESPHARAEPELERNRGRIVVEAPMPSSRG